MMIPVSALSHRQVGPNRKKVFFFILGGREDDGSRTFVVELVACSDR